MIWVTEAAPLPKHRLQLRFSDGTESEVSLRELIFTDHRPIVIGLRDANAFTACHVEMDTVVWENGFDLAPEYLYEKVLDQSAA